MKAVCAVLLLACLLGLTIRVQSQAEIQENISNIASNFHVPSNIPGGNYIPSNVPGGSGGSGSSGGYASPLGNLSPYGSGSSGGTGSSGSTGVLGPLGSGSPGGAANNAKLTKDIAEFLMDPCTIKTFKRLAELSAEVNEAQNSNSEKEAPKSLRGPG